MDRIALLSAAVTAVLLAAGCVGTPPPPSDVTTADYATHFLVERLAGDDLHVVRLGSPGVDPHHFEPTLSDIETLRGTKLLLVHGMGLDTWVDRALRTLGNDAPPVLRVGGPAPGDPLLDGEPHDNDHGHHDHHHDDGPVEDPHTWLDPVAYRHQAARVADHLAQRFPEHAANISERAAGLDEDLRQLHREYAQGIVVCDLDLIAVNHNAYGYLAHRYGFGVISVHGIEPGAQPSPQQVDEILRAIREHGLPVLFVEEGTGPVTVRSIEREAQRDDPDFRVRVLHTLETDPAEGDYFAAMRDNLQALRQALKCR